MDTTGRMLGLLVSLLLAQLGPVSSFPVVSSSQAVAAAVAIHQSQAEAWNADPLA